MGDPAAESEGFEVFLGKGAEDFADGPFEGFELDRDFASLVSYAKEDEIHGFLGTEEAFADLAGGAGEEAVRIGMLSNEGFVAGRFENIFAKEGEDGWGHVSIHNGAGVLGTADALVGGGIEDAGGFEEIQAN